MRNGKTLNGKPAPWAPDHLFRICIYAGAHSGADHRYADAARALVEALAERNLGMVYGGGRTGLMGVLAETALERGVDIIGVVPRVLEHKELARLDLDDLRVVDTMHQRKMLMAELADAFVALPGGVGTLEELIEALTWTKLGLHRKPSGLLDVGGYWTPLQQQLDNAVREGFLTAENRRALPSSSDPAQLLDGFAGWQAPGIDGRLISDRDRRFQQISLPLPMVNGNHPGYATTATDVGGGTGRAGVHSGR